jgi:hypothetical protein
MKLRSASLSLATPPWNDNELYVQNPYRAEVTKVSTEGGALDGELALALRLAGMVELKQRPLSRLPH